MRKDGYIMTAQCLNLPCHSFTLNVYIGIMRLLHEMARDVLQKEVTD